jgi:hypothetical protein
MLRGTGAEGCIKRPRCKQSVDCTAHVPTRYESTQACVQVACVQRDTQVGTQQSCTCKCVD